MIRTYTEMASHPDLESRWSYLSLRGVVGQATFGFERFVNQRFYRSREWQQVRSHVITRDNGCDLGVDGYEIHDRIIIHHMNPMELRDIEDGNEAIIDPEFLITTTHQTHNAIHYGDVSLLPSVFKPRSPGDTKLW